MDRRPIALDISEATGYAQATMKIAWRELVIQTTHNNLAALDPTLAPLVEPHHTFSLHDLTDQLQQIVTEEHLTQGALIAHSHHTTTVLHINEFNEPMLMMDMLRALETVAPKVHEYLHNSTLRTENLCANLENCDRNADAHIKAYLSGGPSVHLLVRDRRLVLGQWQRVALIDYDGPRERKITVQLMGA